MERKSMCPQYVEHKLPQEAGRDWIMEGPASQAGDLIGNGYPGEMYNPIIMEKINSWG